MNWIFKKLQFLILGFAISFGMGCKKNDGHKDIAKFIDPKKASQGLNPAEKKEEEPEKKVDPEAKIEKKTATTPGEIYSEHLTHLSQVLEALGVNQGDYKGNLDYDKIFHDEPKKTFLNSFLKYSETLKKSPIQWKSNDDIAFLINVYNARIIQYVLSHYQGENAPATIWDEGKSDTLFKTECTVGLNENIKNLGDLNKTIKEKLKNILLEGEKHLMFFAMTSGSHRCVPLAQKLYSGDQLILQLKDQEKQFFKYSSVAKVNEDGKLEIADFIFDNAEIFKKTQTVTNPDELKLSGYIQDHWEKSNSVKDEISKIEIGKTSKLKPDFSLNIIKRREP